LHHKPMKRLRPAGSRAGSGKVTRMLIAGPEDAGAQEILG
jgi:hypothetical protein